MWPFLPRRKPPKRLPDESLRLLVVPHRFIGDVVVLMPVLRYLKQVFSHLQLDMLTTPAIADMLAPCSWVDTCWVEPSSKAERAQVYQQIARQQYHGALYLRPSFGGVLRVRQAGLPWIVGFDEQYVLSHRWVHRGAWGIDAPVSAPSLTSHQPQLESLFGAIEPVLSAYANVPLPEPDKALALTVMPQDTAWAAQYMAQRHSVPNKPIAVVHLQSASKQKLMPLEIFVPALQVLEQSGYALVAVGTGQDALAYDELQQRYALTLQNACGQTTLRQLAALLQQSQLLFSLDSAPIHMATAMATPNIIGVYGPMLHQRWGPYPYTGRFTPIYNQALTCRPCVAKSCGHNQCRTGLTPQQIAAQVQQHLERAY